MNVLSKSVHWFKNNILTSKLTDTESHGAQVFVISYYQCSSNVIFFKSVQLPHYSLNYKWVIELKY